jgi:hypothetical protein
LARSWARLESVVFRGGELFEGGQIYPSPASIELMSSSLRFFPPFFALLSARSIFKAAFLDYGGGRNGESDKERRRQETIYERVERVYEKNRKEETDCVERQTNGSTVW